MSSQRPTVTLINEDLSAGAEDVPILFHVDVPDLRADGRESVPTDIVCVIDISGSMGTLATIQSASGVVESNGLTLLDVAKHGVRTVIAALGVSDRCAVVAFDDKQDIVVPLTVMDEAGKAMANEKLEALDDRGGTDIWGGLLEGLEILRNAATNATADPRVAHVILLTDGQTMRRNTCMPNARQYRDRYEGLPGTISTMGFGYNIDSPLLNELAKFGNGTYSFIPDAGFVGTIFVNTVSNLLCCMATDVTLDIQAEDDATVLQVCGGIDAEKIGEQWRLNLGLLLFGQSRDIVVRAKVPAGGKLEATLSYRALNGAGAMESQRSELAILQAAAASPTGIQWLHRHVQRCDYVDSVQLAVDTASLEVADAADIVRNLAQRVASSKAASDEHVQKLLEDIQGQTLEAFSKTEYWNKWGCHYVPAALCAHRCQVCNNFKDPGVQVYGGTMFAAIQEKADTLFNELPPPTHANMPFGEDDGAPVNMARYNDRDAA